MKTDQIYAEVTRRVIAQLELAVAKGETLTVTDGGTRYAILSR